MISFDNEQEIANLVQSLSCETKFSNIINLHGKTLVISISLDNKFPNNIFLNSRYAKFMLTEYGELELAGKQFIMPKFRKTVVKSIEDAIIKINKYIEGAKNEKFVR